MATDPGSISQRFSLILGGIGRGLSGNAIIRELQGAGLGLRLTTLRTLINQARTWWSSATSAATADLETPYTPPAGNIWPSRTMTGYGYVVQVAYRDLGTGEIGTMHYTTISDTPITPGQAIGEALNLPPSYFQEAERLPIGAVLANAYTYTPMEI